jgi:hypothetical protein
MITCSPDGAKRHPGTLIPHFAALNAGYELNGEELQCL